jgi:Cof subfamily protein (haloacid dehalogenase superfamily)
MMRYAEDLAFDVAMLTLNGAAVYQSKSSDAPPIYSATIGTTYSDYLINYTAERRMALNYYHGGKLYAVRDRYTMPWLELYKSQTHSPYVYVDSLSSFTGDAPFKALIVADAATLDEEEKRFRAMWDSEIYIVRTWDYYLEFLDKKATKGFGLAALALSFGIDIADTVSFGDANNDIPMLESAGIGIAMKNASDEVKASASHVSEWTNEEDGVAREWERLKRL